VIGRSESKGDADDRSEDLMDSRCTDAENSGRWSLDHVDDEEGSGPFNGISYVSMKDRY
jgi:hypothetical protein